MPASTLDLTFNSTTPQRDVLVIVPTSTMRSGNYIQALGRQSFQPSQPASASSPRDEMLPSEQANERQRELIKAQNDVLATVGVCLRDNKQHYEETESRKAEDWAGLYVGVLDLTVTYLASWPLIGIRNRLQVCDIWIEAE